jgi:hypothetical protein
MSETVSNTGVLTPVDEQYHLLTHYLGVNQLFHSPYRIEPKERYNAVDLFGPYQPRVLLPFSALVSMLGFPHRYGLDYPAKHFSALYYSVLMRLWAALANRLNDLRCNQKIELTRIVNTNEYVRGGQQPDTVYPIEMWWERMQRVSIPDNPFVLPVTFDGFKGKASAGVRRLAEADPALQCLTTVDGLVIWLGMSDEEILYWVGYVGHGTSPICQLFFPGDEHSHAAFGRVHDCPTMLFSDRFELNSCNSEHGDGNSTGQLVGRSSI